jgi:hypothetical protein
MMHRGVCAVETQGVSHVEGEGMMLSEACRCWVVAFAAVMLCAIAATRVEGANLALAMDTGSEPSDLAVQSMMIESSPESSVLNVQQFGAIANDGKDDSDAFVEACRRASLTWRPLRIPPGTYEIDKRTTITCTGDLHLIGQRDVHINLDALLTFQADMADESLVLRADAPRKTRSISVDDTSQCWVGDLVCIDTKVVAESAWKTPKREVHRIETVPDATTLVFEEPLAFSYDTADDGLSISCYRSRRIMIANVAFDVNDRQLSTQYFSGGTVLYNCRWTERDVGEQDGYLYSPGYSVGVTVTDGSFEGGYYGCIPACSRDVTFEKTTGYRCAGSVIAPNNWCYGVHVNGISGRECGTLVDSHPSFEVHYSNVSGQITKFPNLRSLGGSIRNHKVETTLSAPKMLQFQNIDLLVDPEIYDETTLLLEDFTLTTRNLDLDANLSANRAIVQYGCRAILKNVNWRDFDFYPGPLWGRPRHGFHEIEVTDCNLTSIALWGGQRAVVQDSRFANVAGDEGAAITIRLDSRCSVSNTTFADYTHAISISSTQVIDLTDCQFTNCGTVFAASGTAPNVVFDRCQFRDTGGWGDVRAKRLQVRDCTFESRVDGGFSPSKPFDTR